MALFVQFAVGLAVRGLVAGARGVATGLVARPVSAALVRATAAEGFRQTATVGFASEIIARELVDGILALAPDMADRENWSRQAAEHTARLIVARAREHYLRGPRPKRLQTVTGESARNLTTVQRGETVAAGSPDPWMLWFETRDDTDRWRDRAWLQPAVRDVLETVPDAWVQAWRQAQVAAS